MANYFYVKSGFGTRTADTSFTAAETGAFNAGNLTAANCYPSLESLTKLTTPPVDGDFVYISDLSAATYGAAASTPQFNTNGTITGAGLYIVSVDDTDVTVYKPGAEETNTNALQDFLFKFNGLMAGVSLTSSNDTFEVVGHWIAQDGTLTATGAFDNCIRLASDNSSARLVNINLNTDNLQVEPIFVGNGCSAWWDGGILGGIAEPDWVVSGAFNGGAFVELNGIDLSAASGNIVESTDQTNSDSLLVRLLNCRLHPSVTIHGTLHEFMHRVEMFNCDDSTGGDYFRFTVATGHNSIAKNNEATYVTATKPWYSGTSKSSISVVTGANTSLIRPFVFSLPSQYVDLGDVTKDVLTINLVTNLTLTDTDIIAFLVYPDGTTPVLPRIVQSSSPVTGSKAVNPMGSGTTLATSALGAGDWTGEPASPNFYKLVLDTSSVAGEEAVVKVRIEVYKPNIDGTTNKLFIHPLATVSAS